jgi:hypothetical protein
MPAVSTPTTSNLFRRNYNAAEGKAATQPETDGTPAVSRTRVRPVRNLVTTLTEASPCVNKFRAETPRQHVRTSEVPSERQEM